MNNDTHETAPTQSVETNGTRLAYLRFGKRGTTPLFLLGYPTLFQVGHEFEFDDYLAAIRDVFRPGKTGIVLLKNQN